MIRNTDKSAYEYYLESVKVNDKAIHYFSYEMDHQALIYDIDKMASFLNKRYIFAGSCISVCLPNIPNAIVAFYASNKLGAIVNMLHPLLPKDAIAKSLKTTKTRILFILDTMYEKLKDVLEKEKVLTVICSLSDYMPKLHKIIYDLKNRQNRVKTISSNKNVVKYTDALLVDLVAIDGCVTDGQKTCLYLNSGGTTGSPSTVVISNYAFNELARIAAPILTKKNYVGPKETCLLLLPLFHGFGIGIGMHAMFSLGITVALAPKYNERLLARIMSKAAVSIMIGVPKLYEKILHSRKCLASMSKVKTVFSGGDLLLADSKREYCSILSKYTKTSEIYEGYGLSEVVTVCTSNSKFKSKEGSVGYPLENVKIKIIAPSGEVLEPMQNGEICVNSSTMMSSYYKNSRCESEYIVYIEGEKYIKTGDIGYLDNDGCLFFVSRIKRIIRIASINIYPSEIEKIVSNMPFIKECCAVEMLDDNNKNYVRLYTVLKDNENLSAEMAEMIRNKISSNLIKYAIPKEITQLKELPYTIIGKIDYNKLQKDSLTVQYDVL